MGSSHIHIHNLKRVADGQASEKVNQQVIILGVPDHVSVADTGTIYYFAYGHCNYCPYLGNLSPRTSTSYPIKMKENFNVVRLFA